MYGWCYDYIINTCFEVEDCHVAVSTAPRNDNAVLVFYVEDCRVAVSTAPRNDNEVLVFNVMDSSPSAQNDDDGDYL